MFESNTIQKPVGNHAINLTITSVNIKLGTKHKNSTALLMRLHSINLHNTDFHGIPQYDL